MYYSVDLRRKVIEFVKEGGSQTQATGLFKISRKTIYNWIQRSDLTPRLGTTRRRKLTQQAIFQQIRAHPDARLADYAHALGVTPNAIWYQFKKLGITKKNDPLSGKSVYRAD